MKLLIENIQHRLPQLQYKNVQLDTLETRNIPIAKYEGVKGDDVEDLFKSFGKLQLSVHRLGWLMYEYVYQHNSEDDIYANRCIESGCESYYNNINRLVNMVSSYWEY